MAELTYKERIGRALDLFGQGFSEFVDREMRPKLGDNWVKVYSERKAANLGRRPTEASAVDPQFLVGVVEDSWREVFDRTLSRAHRSYLHILRDYRNQWAHPKAEFSADDVYRVLDAVHALLEAASSPQATQAAKDKEDFQRARYEKQRRERTRTMVPTTSESLAVANLLPWREIMVPHEDVRAGRYQQAEFAADLFQVYSGEGSDEYRDPLEFFRRTYLTQGLHDLLVASLQRVAGTGGAPVVELQTNFGGGKTHSLLALFHLFGGADLTSLQAIEDLARDAGLTFVPKAYRAVLVGTRLQPGQPWTKPDGTTIHTMWGELAWQLGGADGYAMIAQADQTGTSPGEALQTLLREHSPCVILIDEWVAYARQLLGKEDLIGGSFETHFTFAQALTEAARATEGVLLVVSIPSSDRIARESSPTDIEVGGEAGQIALQRLKNVIGRIDTPWRPASSEEAFQIVRRRLFDELTDASKIAARDAICKAFVDYYSKNRSDFPTDCSERAYEARLRDAYPIHPELFDRLYDDWSTLPRFQRTRGVLRLMATVIHSLWRDDDAAPMITPGSIPLDDAQVFGELGKYLEDQWKPVIDSEVDGPDSLPVRLESATPAFGARAICRRVARTIYLASAPRWNSGHAGADDRSIRLGCALPGEQVAVFGDALRRLTYDAQYLYVDQGRYWYSIRTNVTRTAKDRADKYPDEDVRVEIVRRLGAEQKRRGDFNSIHIAPTTSGDVPDDAEARLVILGPDKPYSSKEQSSLALDATKELIQTRGNGPRRYRNMVVCLAADATRLAELVASVRSCLAWTSIQRDADDLELTNQQRTQTETRVRQENEAAEARLAETYQWLIVPHQPEPKGDVTFEPVKVSGGGSIAERVSKRMANDETLVTALGPNVLRQHLDRIPLWRDNHVEVRQLWEDFAQYLYLPRLREESVLRRAIEEAPSRLAWEQETFTYAESFDQESGRYIGLIDPPSNVPIVAPSGLVVHPRAAAPQLERDRAAAGVERPGVVGEGEASPEESGTSTTPTGPRRFHGTVVLGTDRPNDDFARIIREVARHLTVPKSDVRLTLEIEAILPEPATPEQVRTVTENARSLKFDAVEFEQE